MSYARYGDYKESGIDWLGTVPSHWQIMPIKRVARLQGGTGFPDHEQGLKDEQLPFYKVSDTNLLGNAVYMVNENNSVSTATAKRLHAHVIPMNAVIFPKVGAVLLLNKRRITTRDCCIDNNMMSATPLHCDVKWFYYWLSGLDLRPFSNPGAVPSINEGQVREIALPVPPPREQQAIANFLDRKTAQIDSLVEKKQTLLDRLTQLRTALICTAVTKGLDPNCAMKESGIEWLGMIPDAWSTCQLKRVAALSYGVGGEIDRSLMSGTRLLSLPNISIDGILLADEGPFCELEPNERSVQLLKRGDLLFNWRNGSSDHLGKTAYFDLDGDWAHVSFLVKLRFDAAVSESRYFQYMLTGLRLTGFFSSSKSGVNNTFNSNELANLWIMNPPRDEQVAIAKFLDERTTKLDLQKAKIQTAIDALLEYRRSLVCAAVTGNIDVREYEATKSREGESIHA